MKLLWNEGIITMEEKLQIGMVNDEFSLFYQPQFNLSEEKLIGMEALARWIPPEEDMISPTVFIPVAEETGQIYELERILMQKALCQKLQWEKEGYGHVKMAINLSGRTLGDEMAFCELEQIMDQNLVDYSKVTMEITETSIITNTDRVAERLHRLKTRGMSIALDDFGTGYSSLSYLGKFPIDIIKLDRSYIHSLPHNRVQTAIVKNMLQLANDLHYTVIAEGIETKEQLDYLLKHDCQNGQGYLFSKPLSQEKISAIMKKSTESIRDF